MNKILTVKCPTCEREFNYFSSEFRPFCCEKCKMVDLGHWFKESYKVPLKETDKDNEENEKTKRHPNDGEEEIDEDSEYL